MKSIFNKLEKVIFTLSIFCFLLLLIIQGLNYNNSINSLEIYNNRNVFSTSETENNKEGILILKNITPKYKDVEVLLNGNCIGNFLENDEMEVRVDDGDIVEIDGTRYSSNLNIKIVGISSNVKSPELNLILTISQSIEILGEVKLK